MKIQTLVIILIVFVFVTACAIAESATEPPAATEMPALTATQIATATFTPSPTLYPPAKPIDVSNAGEIAEVLTIGRGALQDTVLSPDGTEVLVATSIGFYICDAQTLQIEEFISIDGARNVAWSPDGQLLAFSVVTDIEWPAQQELYIYDLGSKEFSSLYKPQRGWELDGISWNGESSAIALESANWGSGGVGQTSLLIVELESGLVRLNAPVTGWPGTASWAPDGQTFAISMRSNPNVSSLRSSVIQVWGPDRTNPLLSIPTTASGSLGWASDGSKLSLQTQEGLFYVYDAKTGDELLLVDSGLDQGGYRMFHEWTGNDENIRFLDPKGDLWQIDIVDGRLELLDERGLDENVFALSLESAVVYAIMDGNLKVIRLDTGEMAGRFTGLAASATHAYLMRDQRMLCTVKDYLDYDDNKLGSIVRLWDLSNGEEVFIDNTDLCSEFISNEEVEQPGWSGPVEPATRTVDNSRSLSTYSEGETWLSPDGKIQLVVAPSGALEVKDTSTGETKHTLSESDSGISLVAGSPNGEYVVAFGKDKVIKIWRLEDGELVDNIGREGLWWFPIIWSPDSGRILFFNSPDQASVFDLSEETTSSLDINPVDVDELAPELFSWSPDGSMILGAGEFGVELFDAASGEILKHLSDEVVDGFSWSPRSDFRLDWLDDGAWVFISHGNGTASLWGLDQP